MVFHLAALLSTRGERDPELAHQVNVEGTLNVLRMAQNQSSRLGRPVRFLFPSSIAVYGLPIARGEARASGACARSSGTCPSRCTAATSCTASTSAATSRSTPASSARSSGAARLDFRALRFPGLISAETVPTGGTSDFGPEMIHAAAQRHAVHVLRRARGAHPVHGDARRRARAPRSRSRRPRAALDVRLQHRRVQRSSAAEIADRVQRAFPGAPHRLRARPGAREDRRLVAGGRRRRARARATGAGSPRTTSTARSTSTSCRASRPATLGAHLSAGFLFCLGGRTRGCRRSRRLARRCSYDLRGPRSRSAL